MHPNVEFHPDSDTPYPIWFLDPEGPAYATVLQVARAGADALATLHEVTGLPWWSTIIVGTLLARCALMPLNIIALRNAAKSFDAREDISALVKAYQRAMSRLGMHASAAERFQLQRTLVTGARAALHKAHCYPWRTFALPFVHWPALTAAALGGRHLVMLGDESFETGGAAWFTDLTVSDPTYFLPAIAYISSYAFLEYVYQPGRLQQRTAGAAALLGGRVVRVLKNTGQLWLLLTIPVTYQLPAGLYLGWITGTVWAAAWVATVRTDAFHQLLTGRRAPRYASAAQQAMDIEGVPAAPAPQQHAAPGADLPQRIQGATAAALEAAAAAAAGAPGAAPASHAGGQPAQRVVEIEDDDVQVVSDDVPLREPVIPPVPSKRT